VHVHSISSVDDCGNGHQLLDWGNYYTRQVVGSENKCFLSGRCWVLISESSTANCSFYFSTRDVQTCKRFPLTWIPCYLNQTARWSKRTLFMKMAYACTEDSSPINTPSAVLQKSNFPPQVKRLCKQYPSLFFPFTKLLCAFGFEGYFCGSKTYTIWKYLIYIKIRKNITSPQYKFPAAGLTSF